MEKISEQGFLCLGSFTFDKYWPFIVLVMEEAMGELENMILGKCIKNIRTVICLWRWNEGNDKVVVIIICATVWCLKARD